MTRLALLALTGLSISGTATAAEILIYSDTPGTNLAAQAAVNRGHNAAVYTSDTAARAAFDAGNFDMVILELSQPSASAEIVDLTRVATYNDVFMIISWAGIRSRTLMQTYLNLRPDTEYSVPIDIFSAPGATWDFLAPIGGVLTGGADVGEPNVTTVTPIFGQNGVEGDDGAGNSIIVSVNADYAVVNSFTVLDYVGVDNDGDYVNDMVEVYQEEIDFFLYEPPPMLQITGTCPGQINIDVQNISPYRLAAFSRSASIGSAVLPQGSCTGLQIDLQKPVQYMGAFRADISGNISLTGNAGPASCGTFVQVFDAYTCELTEVAQVPF